ncbi:MAG: DUF2088 domain-containing protein [Planctomycetales bacterium]|nr:DUF2088 domain-containing protein [Planctomycetales bacterium]
MKLYKVHQQLVSNPLPDVAAEVRRQLDALVERGHQVPQGDVAITAGSRGIDNIALVTKTAGQWLKEQGAEPFIVPAMGSHNGATAEGQRAMVESLGITESAMGMPIRSSMECVKVGEVSTGDVWMDRFCYEAAGVLVLNRVKLHTCFSGPVQSGITKMMVVGMGKIKSAQTFHTTPTFEMKHMLLEMGQLLVKSGKIWAGLALLEDGFDKTAEIHALPAGGILQKEAELLQKHRGYFPGLPIDDISVLVVNEIGKTYSGTGMDTNVIGYRGVRGGEDLDRPRIKIIAALNLADASKGNAIGVGLADFITQRLRDKIDEYKTFLNVYTTGDMDRAKIPATLADDQVVVEKIRERYGDQRWMFIPNTLHLGALYVTEDLVEEAAASSICTVDKSPTAIGYEAGRLRLDW